MGKELDFLCEFVDLIFLNEVNILLNSLGELFFIDDWLALGFHDYDLIDIFQN
jgi:hypothetical protein